MNLPVRDDERELWALVAAGMKPRAAAAFLGIAAGRVEYLCGKWARQGLYDWGVVHDLGWVLPGAIERWERLHQERTDG